MNKGKLKTNRGITLATLIITIVVMVIIAGTTVYTSLNRFEINKLKKMYNDIELLSNKIANYYLKYNGLPVVKDSENNSIKYTYTVLNFDKSINDNENYYILDLEAMEGISLNYGENGFKNINASDDVYIINEASHVIYYVQGIEVDGEMYYTIPEEENGANDTIPPIKPEINIVSGTLNHDGTYMTEVGIEIVQGKDNWSGIDKTTYSINDGTEEDITTLTNNILKITEDGTYTIKARSYDKNGNVSGYTTMQFTTTILKIGDYVEYDLEYEDMYYTGKIYGRTDGWRYLGKDDNGNYLIVSTGIPGILYYYYNPDTKPDWWATDDEVTSEYGATYSENGWDYDNGGYPNRYAAYGLRHKFERIPFTYQESGTYFLTKNTGIFRKVGDTTSGAGVNLNFRANGVNIVDVHNLTLAELNRATNIASGSTREDTSTAGGFKDLIGSAVGLFDMQSLNGYTVSYKYWLVYYSQNNYMCVVSSDGPGFFGTDNHGCGVRPVVTLSKDIILTKNNNGVWQISQ